jgi:hypothetical protein
MVPMLRLLIALLLAGTAIAGDWFVFTSFRKNGETGVYLALSADGRTWTPLNDNQPWIKPEHAGMLMRDPYLVQGPDGMYHLLWTWGWTRKETGGTLRIGHSSSKDLIHWTSQEEIKVLEEEPEARNAWAPEAIWDPTRKEWIIFWSTTIPGRFPETETTGDSGYNHRLYSMTTRDWKTFSPARLWFDPGFNSIDATLARDGDRWVMVFKDERVKPLQKRLRLAFADSPRGPWRNISEPFTTDWVEGPSVLRLGNEWWIYFDHYRSPHYYGAVRTRDWKKFEDVSSLVRFPEDHRHGTAIRIPETLAKKLQHRID